jgi:hypothetical protein
MYLIRDEMWNSVDIYGPQVDIDCFKHLFIVQGPANDWEDNKLAIDLARIPGDCSDAWNFREFGPHERGVYSMAFDTAGSFPTDSLESLAQLFPKLAFDCECIADDDRSMGYGWFNTPPGGEDFRDDFEVPEGYWERGGGKRTPAAEKQHMAVIAALKRTLQEADGDR